MVTMGSKHVFWQAFVFTIVVFGVGIVFGYYLESSRASNVEFNLLASEINLLDQQMRGKIVGESNLSCEIAVGSTFTFADKIYEDALKLEKYGSSSKFNEEIMLVLHRRYDLLRTMLWDESIKLKKRCPSFHTVVYFFDYEPESVELKGEQDFFSRLLIDAKNSNPGRILLIPIAANLDLSSVELAIENYKIKKMPSVLIDEKTVVDEIVTLQEMEGFIFSTNKTAA